MPVRFSLTLFPAAARRAPAVATSTAVAAALVVSLLTGVTGAFAQSGATALRGEVRDSQGRPVPAAAVVVDPQGPGLDRQATTDADGTFVVPNLPPGLADVTVRADRFQERRFTALTLEAGQTAFLTVALAPAGVEERVTVTGGLTALDTSGSVVDAVIGRREIDALPLNGRNFLELALLVPGNAPAPTFDPTKANVVTISSAGQLGRGGNIMIDGADNNDDVVGGPLQNVTQEAVQEFQIATNRFTAEAGRSASSIINIVTKSGGDALQGSASLYLRDHRWQGLPATFDRTSGEEPPFDRQQIAGAAGGPLARNRLWWFGALEYRNQDGAILVGERDTVARTIRRSFAAAPLDDLLGTWRADWRAGDADQVMVRYALQREEDIAASTVERAIGSATQRQQSRNRLHAVVGTWNRVLSPSSVNAVSAGVSTFRNAIAPTDPGRPQLTFPSLQDGSSFRVPQGTEQTRFQIADTWSLVHGPHLLRVGGEWQRVDGKFDLGVFREGRIELVQDFPFFDHNGDGRVDDNDLLFAVTLRSGRPDRALVLDNCDNNYVAFFVQDDWRVRPDLTVNLGLRYELDTNVKNLSGVADINPIVQPFLQGTRGRDANNLGPRVGFNWSPGRGRTSVHGGYGLYYDRVTLQIMSLERGLDGRALPIEVRAGSVMFVDPDTGRFAPGTPTLANPFTGFILPGAGASGINIIDNGLQNPQVQQFNLGVEQLLPAGIVLRVDGVHNFGTHFIIGRTLGTVFNPVVGGPDRVVNLESSARTKYDALLVQATWAGTEQRRSQYAIRAGYALSKAFNYANDDQIPFANGPIDPTNLRLEYGPTPNDQRHRFTLTATVDGPAGIQFASLLTLASGVPMDILMPDGQSRIPTLQRNAGGRQFQTGAELNAYLRAQNERGGIDGERLPLVNDDLRFSDGFSAFDVRLSRSFTVGQGARAIRIEPMLEIFNLFNVTNVLGANTVNYSGAANVLVRDSDDPAAPGYLRSSRFGQPVSTAGGVFGSGGPRALQVAVRARF